MEGEITWLKEELEPPMQLKEELEEVKACNLQLEWGEVHHSSG